MSNFKLLNNLTGWLVFGIATLVYALSAEPTGSLWDCGEFISAAHKLEVVHPPGAPLFLMIGRIFIVFMGFFMDMEGKPENIGYAMNLLSGICTAFAVLFIFWTTTILARLTLTGRERLPESLGEMVAVLGSGLVAGLAATFATSIWFSAVEGEVYAMSLFFTGIVIWAGARWYASDSPKADRWLVFIAYMVGLSIGVHLLSLLVIPFVSVLFYYKNMAPKATPVLVVKRDAQNNEYTEEVLKTPLGWKGTILSFIAGMVILVFVQYIIIPKMPQMAAWFDFTFVNSLGLGLGSGVLFFIVLIAAGLVAGLWYAARHRNYYLQMGLTMLTMVIIGFSTYGMVVIRAAANPPINMNDPSDPYSLLSYLNREQYGDRPLLYGPHYMAKRKGHKKTADVYRPVKDEVSGKYKYKAVDEKIELTYDSKDYMLFPRLGHMDRGGQYKGWLGLKGDKKPTMGDNIGFLFNYQIGWMYMRYFMWNFAGRQNTLQGFSADDGRRGHWISGVGFLDEMRVHQQSNLPETMANDKGRNTYYFLPLIFGLMGMFFHFARRSREATAVFVLFFMTGLAIILFLNQPPQEPRERDYAFAGSILAFCIWIGMGVSALYEWLRKPLSSAGAAALGLCLALTAPVIMAVQNWDDHSRAEHYAARDYAINFLESCAPNAILFTYGDNDTYPLWYAQEVEGIRTDVRVINFSLLAVDWYINQLRRKINNSEQVKMTIPEAAYRGKLRNYLPIMDKGAKNILDVVKFMGESHPLQGDDFASYVNAGTLTIPIDKELMRKNKVVADSIPDSLIVEQMNIVLGEGKQVLMKDEIALLDIIATNAANGWERPIYFAVTNRPEKIMGFRDYLQLEGMALRVVPVYTPSRDMYGATGMGAVATDIMYDNIMNKFRWGNFDKKELFVDESYMPSVHSTQLGMMRLTEQLIRKNDKERAVNVIKKLFEVYPDMNFPLEENRLALQMINFAYAIEAEEAVKEAVSRMAEKLADRQAFYESLTSAKDKRDFKQEIDENAYMMGMLVQMVREAGKDAELKTKVEGLLGGYAPKDTRLPN